MISKLDFNVSSLDMLIGSTIDDTHWCGMAFVLRTESGLINLPDLGQLHEEMGDPSVHQDSYVVFGDHKKSLWDLDINELMGAKFTKFELDEGWSPAQKNEGKTVKPGEVIFTTDKWRLHMPGLMLYVGTEYAGRSFFVEVVTPNIQFAA